MSEHLGEEPAPAWLRDAFPGFAFKRGISGRWFAWQPGNAGGPPDFMADSPGDLRDDIIRAAWQTAEARSGT